MPLTDLVELPAAHDIEAVVPDCSCGILRWLVCADGAPGTTYDDFVTIVEEIVLAEEALEQDANDVLPIIQVYASNLALAVLKVYPALR